MQGAKERYRDPKSSLQYQKKRNIRKIMNK